MIKNFCKILFVRITFLLRKNYEQHIYILLLHSLPNFVSYTDIIHRINNPKKLVKDVFYLIKKLKKFMRKSVYIRFAYYIERTSYFSVYDEMLGKDGAL